MRLTLTRFYQDIRSLTTVGELDIGDYRYWTAERVWLDNQRNISCVPAGFYVLEPHNGSRYQGTWALIGDSVSHEEEPGVARFACVLHWATRGELLAGCVSTGMRLKRRTADGAVQLADNAVPNVLARLDAENGPHYLTIRDPA